MKKYIYIPLLLLLMVVATDAAMAQARISRTEFLCYDKREDAKRDIRTNIENYITIAPELQFETSEGAVRRVYEQKITIPLLGAFANAGAGEEARVRELVRGIVDHPEYRDEIVSFVKANGGIDYAVPSFMSFVGDRDNKVCLDTPNESNSGTITYTYGALSFELTIDIDR